MKKKTKKRIKIKSLLIVLVFILIISLSIYYYSTLKITNIYVTGNKILRESDIIKEVELDNYPNIYKVNEYKIKEKLLLNPLIKSVKVKKTFLGKVIIEIEENIPIIKDIDGKYILNSGEKINSESKYNVPSLINEVDSDIYNNFIKGFSKVSNDILIKISEIKYDKTDLDKERFLLLMNDGNYVYITLSRIELVNSYNEIYPTLDNNKGILHLDSGNHFEIKNKINN